MSEATPSFKESEAESLIDQATMRKKAKSQISGFSLISSVLQLSAAMKKSLPNETFLDTFIFIVTYVRLILWPIYVLKSAEDWSPQPITSFIRTAGSLLNDTNTWEDNPNNKLYIFLSFSILVTIHALLVISATLFKVLRNFKPFVGGLYIIMGGLEYSFMPTISRSISIIFDCENIENIRCEDPLRKGLFALGALSLLALLLSTGVYCIGSFDCRIISQNYFHRMPFADITLFWVIQIVTSGLDIYQHFFNDFDDKFELSIILILYALYAFILLNGKYYYNSTIDKIIRLCATCMLVSVTLSLIFAFMPNIFKNSALYLWLFIEIIIIIGFFVLNSDHLSYDNGTNTEIQHENRFFIYEYLSNKKVTKGITLQIQGFIFTHAKACNDPCCPLVESLKVKEDPFFNEKTHERLQRTLLIRFILYKLVKAAETETYNSALRLETAQFMLEILQNCRRAQTELMFVKPQSLLEKVWKFFIYERIKEFDINTAPDFMSDKRQDTRQVEDKNRKEALLVMLRKSEVKLCKLATRSAESCYRLWGYLSLDRPNLDLSEKLLVNAVICYQDVIAIWKEIEQFPYVPSILRKLYAIYMRDVLGDYAAYNWQNEIAAEIENKIEQDDDTLEQATFHIDSQSTAIIIASSEPFQAWRISRANMATCQLFGYVFDEILDRPIEILLPKLLREDHLKATLKVTENDFRSTTTFGFGLHKNGFIIPVNIRIVKSAPIGEDAMLIAGFRPVKALNKAYIITDTNFEIMNISSNAELILGHKKDVIRINHYDIRALIPIIKQIFIEQLLGNTIKFSKEEFKDREFSISAGQIKMRNSPEVGYYFCITWTMLQINSDSKIPNSAISNFRLMYDPEAGLFVRTWVEKAYAHNRMSQITLDRLETKVREDEGSEFFKMLEVLSRKQDFMGFIGSRIIQIYGNLTLSEKMGFQEKVNLLKYSKHTEEFHVKILRLVNQVKEEVVEIPYFQRYEQCVGTLSEKMSRGKPVAQNNDELNIRQMMSNRDVLTEKLTHGYKAKPLLKLFFGVLLLLNILFIVITVIKGSNDTAFGNNLNVKLEYTEFAFSRLQSFVETLQFVNTMVLINGNMLKERGKSNNEVLDHLMKSLINALDETYIGVNQLYSLRSQKLKQVTQDRIEKPSTPQKLPNGNVNEYYNLATASHMYYGLFQRLTEFDPHQIMQSETYTASIYTNRVIIFSTLTASAKDFLEELFSSILDYSSLLDYFIYIPTICADVSIMIIIGLVLAMQRNKVRNLSAFLSLSTRKLEKHTKTIEDFIIFMKNRSGVETEPENNGVQEKAETKKITFKKEIQPTTREQRNKRYEYSRISTINKIFKYSILYLLFECYFIGLYSVQKGWTEKLKYFKSEYNSTGQSTTFFGVSLVAMMIMLWDRDAALWGRLTSSYFPEVNRHINEIAVNHMLYGKEASSTYNDIFLEVTNGNICKYMTSPIGTFITNDECEQVFDGIFKQGLFAALTHFKAFFNYELRKFIWLNATVSGDDLVRLCIDEINKDEAFYYPFLFTDLIRPALNHLRKSFKKSLNDYISNLMSIQDFVLAVFMFAIAVFQAVYGVTAYLENQWFKKVSLAVAIIPPPMTVNNRAMIDFVKVTVGKSYSQL